jgi:hypothetical protein
MPQDPFAQYAVAPKAPAPTGDPFAAYAVQRPDFRGSNEKDADGNAVVRGTLDALPMIGGMVGGLAGGRVTPAAIVLSGLGGAAGQGVKEVADAAQQPIRRVSGGMEALREANAPLMRMAKAGVTQAGLEGVGQGVSRAVGGTAKAVYRGYLKPSLSQSLLPKAKEIVQTAMDEALPISKAGVATGKRLISEINQQVGHLLGNAKGVVDLHQVAERVRSYAKSRYYKPGSNPQNYEAVMAVADRLDNHPALGLPSGVKPSRVDVPLKTANEIKTAIGDDVGEAAFGVKTKAQKTGEKVAYGATREAIETAAKKEGIPQIGALNDRERRLIDATKTIFRAVEREANQNQLYGAKTAIAGVIGGGAYATGQNDPASAAAWALAARVGLHPAVASRAAITASRMARTAGVTAASAARLAVYAAQSGEPEDK